MFTQWERLYLACVTRQLQPFLTRRLGHDVAKLIVEECLTPDLAFRRLCLENQLTRAKEYLARYPMSRQTVLRCTFHAWMKGLPNLFQGTKYLFSFDNMLDLIFKYRRYDLLDKFPNSDYHIGRFIGKYQESELLDIYDDEQAWWGALVGFFAHNITIDVSLYTNGFDFRHEGWRRLREYVEIHPGCRDFIYKLVKPLNKVSLIFRCC